MHPTMMPRHLHLSHRHLAEISGLTRVTVTEALSHFRQEGYLLKDGYMRCCCARP